MPPRQCLDGMSTPAVSTDHLHPNEATTGYLVQCDISYVSFNWTGNGRIVNHPKNKHLYLKIVAKYHNVRVHILVRRLTSPVTFHCWVLIFLICFMLHFPHKVLHFIPKRHFVPFLTLGPDEFYVPLPIL
jgi:hypothetical protein